jgi:hypothetical protein
MEYWESSKEDPWEGTWTPRNPWAKLDSEIIGYTREETFIIDANNALLVKQDVPEPGSGA